MNISGRFGRCTDFSDRNGPMVVGFLGNVWPHDLTRDQIGLIKSFYGRTDWDHKFYNEWPNEFEPAYSAAKANFKNGFMVIYRKDGKYEQR